MGKERGVGEGADLGEDVLQILEAGEEDEVVAGALGGGGGDGAGDGRGGGGALLERGVDVAVN